MGRKKTKQTQNERGFFGRAWRQARRWSLMALGMATLGYASLDLIDYTLEADLFLVEEVIVEGNCLVTEEEILTAMDIPALVRLWKIEPEVLEARILGLNLVRNVEVRRVLPHTLVVDLEERAPTALLHDQKAEKRFAIDEEAVILFDADDHDSALVARSNRNVDNLPEISGMKRSGWRVGETVDNPRLKDVLRALALAVAREEKWALSLATIDAPKDARGWILRSREIPGEIRLGDRAFIERIGRIEPVSRFLKQENLELAYLDLRFDAQLVIKPVECTPERWLEIVKKHPQPELRDSV